MRLQAALARFLVQLRADGRSPHTVAQYARHVQRFATWLDDHGVDDELSESHPEHIGKRPLPGGLPSMPTPRRVVMVGA